MCHPSAHAYMPTLGRHTDFGLGTPCRSRVARWKPRIAEPMMATLIEQGRVGVRKKTNPRTATNSKCTVCVYLVLRLPWPAHGFWPRHAMSKPSGALEAPHCGANDGYPNRTRPGWGSQKNKPANRHEFEVHRMRIPRPTPTVAGTRILA